MEDKIESQEEELHALNRLVNDLQNRNKKLEQTRESLQDNVETVREKNKKLLEAEKAQKMQMESLKASGENTLEVVMRLGFGLVNIEDSNVAAGEPKYSI